MASGLALATGAAPTVPRPAGWWGWWVLHVPCVVVFPPPPEPGVPGLWSPVRPGLSWDSAPPVCPGLSRETPSLYSPVRPGLSRYIPGCPRPQLPPRSRSCPGLFRDLLLLTPAAVPGRVGLLPPVPVPVQRVRGTAGGPRGATAGSPHPTAARLRARGRGATTRRANPGRDGQPRRRRSGRPIRGAAAPPLPIVRARTRGGPARRDRPTGTLRAAPIRGKGLEDAPGC